MSGENLSFNNEGYELVSNDTNSNMYKELSSSLKECQSFIFNVAFISFGGLQLFLRTLDEIKSSSICGKVLTSDYLNFTDPKALRKLNEFSNIETKIYLQSEKGGFHTKSYIFEYEDFIKVYIGSSNITENALLKNIEWNVRILSKKNHPFIEQIYIRFNELWSQTKLVDSAFLNEYENFINEVRKIKTYEDKFVYREDTVKPNKMQELAIKNLHSLRSRGEKKGLVIAATATGKTYMAAFDIRQFQARRVLFLVHREDILIKAEESFKRVLGPHIDTGIYSGTSKELDHRYVFSTVQSMRNIVHSLHTKTFDYIVVDESHHATADSYQEILNHFKPDFLLGMTATPERTDGMGLFAFYENNIALEIRLHDALESDLVCPFHYFGITEIQGLDLSDLKEAEIKKLSKRLSSTSRVDYIIEKMKLYGHDGNKLKCLAFCASIEHAQFMSQTFNERKIKSVCITGVDSVAERQKLTDQLESNLPDTIEVIFTVDVFNEGIDIPSINTVLLLRPTDSPIVFVQQIGRGLRKLPNKEFVTILDFIGNYSKNFMVAIALKGSRFYDKDSLKLAVKNDFPELPGNTFVQMDEISKDHVLRQLDHENFDSFKYLREEYFNFRNGLDRKPILKLMTYEIYESSPDPIKFINHSKSYIEFLSRTEIKSYNLQSAFPLKYLNIYRQLSSLLPLKRSIEFLVLSAFLKRKSIEKEELFNLVQYQIPKIDRKSYEHAINVLRGAYLDVAQLKNFTPLLSEMDEEIQRTNDFSDFLVNDKESFLEDIIKYGLTRYNREFRDEAYHLPFFKLYETYSMVNAALLSNVEKKHSSYRGQGVFKQGNDYFFFFELEKSSDIRESINYHDSVLDRDHIQWASQNKTTITSPVGQNLIHHLSKGISLHLFVRKSKKVGTQIQPYIYIGKANVVEYKNNRPIHFKLKLENKLPLNIYNELTQIIDPKYN